MLHYSTSSGSSKPLGPASTSDVQATLAMTCCNAIPSDCKQPLIFKTATQQSCPKTGPNRPADAIQPKSKQKSSDRHPDITTMPAAWLIEAPPPKQYIVGWQARPEARGALHRNAPGLARVLGPSEPALLQLVRDPPQGSQPLLLQMLHALTGVSLSPAPPFWSFVWVPLTFLFRVVKLWLWGPRLQ